MGKLGNLIEVPYKELPEEYKKDILVDYNSDGEEIILSSLFGNSMIKWRDGKAYFMIPSERIPFWKLKEFGGYLG